METTDPRQAALRFNELYRRTAGEVPLAELRAYQGWYADLSPAEQATFRFELVRRVIRARRLHVETRTALSEVAHWFPSPAPREGR